MRSAGARELREALDALSSVDPEEPVGEGLRCHYCLAGEGREHAEGCAWVEARTLLGDELARSRRVGEDEEDVAVRLDDEDPNGGRDALLTTLADAARREIASLEAEDVDDLPAAEPFSPPRTEG